MRHIQAATQYLTPEQVEALRRRSDWMGVALVAHAWLVIGLAATVVVAYPNPAVVIIAAMLIGSRQLGLVILMHDAAHGALCRSSWLNERLAQCFCAWPMLADVHVYRRYHLRHHAHAMREADPDVVLTGHYPISRASLKRKLVRDISGRSGFAQRRFQIRDALNAPKPGAANRWHHFWDRLGPAVVANIVLAAIFALTGHWWLYFVCWILPLLTWYQVVLRIRNIAEHAVVAGPDDPLGLARTTYVSWLERALIAPYWVNYHVEHHTIMWVPCYRLRLFNQFMRDNGFGSRMQTARGYLAVLREVTSNNIDKSAPGGGRALGSFGQGYR